MGPRGGARHEALNEGFCQQWVDSPRRGERVGHGRVIFTEKLTAWAFEALQVIPRHCLLMEFGVRWVSGLSKLGGAVREVVALMPGSMLVSTASLSHIFKIQSLL